MEESKGFARHYRVISVGLGAVFRQNVAASLFVLWALPLLLAMCVIMPPWTISDEPFHMLRAVQVAHGGIIGRRLTVARADGVLVTSAGGVSDPSIYAAFDPLKFVAFRVNSRATAAELTASHTVKWRHQASFEMFPNTVRYPPFFYLPDAAAYWLGRAFGMRVDMTLLLARVCNAVAFTLLSGLAIASAKRTRPLLMAVLMLPMSIALAASASQDAILIPLTAMIVAWLDRIIAARREVRTRELCLLAAGVATIGMARPPYAFLALLLLQTPKPNRRTWIAVLVACVAVLIWCGLVGAYALVPVGDFNPAAQLHGLLAAPATIFTIAGNTLLQTGQYASEFVGRVAWNDVTLPAPYLALTGATLAAAASAVMTGPTRRPIWCWLAIGCAVCSIMAAQYLDFTPTRADRVTGLAGRYFTPLVLAAALALPTLQIWAGARRRLADASLIALGLITPAIMMHHIVHRFYVM